ncbi:hypothetical protein OC846_004234 [Tilletia horrida]|uniref:Uncharacterized protein n=1 Tax=Tilletia horrida TaxID=155126 RepID=A0AAN6JT23_9BASI|nr:hypothetical protein OC845_005922 [Tilletia horrida]KAK0549077.1 hypothetical protein OC846_004234 [Tilletia horrida]
MSGNSSGTVDGLITSEDELRLTAQDVDQLDAEHRAAQDASAVADWSRPANQQHEQQEEDIQLGLSPDGAEDDVEQTGDHDDAGMTAFPDDLFVIDNNPDLSLLGAASPQEAESRVEEGDVPMDDLPLPASVPAESKAEPSSSSFNNKAVAQNLAGPGEHVLTHGLLLPSNVILEGEDMQMQDGQGEGLPGDDQDLGDYEQLDATRTAARYYEEEKEAARPCLNASNVELWTSMLPLNVPWWSSVSDAAELAT